MTIDHQSLQRDLLPFAKRYIWWKQPDEAVLYPFHVIAAVMDKGDWDDVLELEESIGHDALRETLRQATVGSFRPRSWHFWHFRLYGSDAEIPPLKTSRF